MQFTANHTYKRPVADVFAALTDFDSVKAKYEALGQSDVKLVRREERDDGSVTLVTRRVVPLELPGFAKRVLSPRQSVTQTDAWSGVDAKGARTGTFVLESKGTPVRVHGELRLASKGAKGCTNSTTVSIECTLPLIGGKIAEIVANDTHRVVDDEQAWMSQHLSSS